MEILNRLKSLEEKFDSLARQMSDPGLVSDQDRYRQVTRAYRELERTIAKYGEYKDVARQIQESQALMQDEEMRAMAREELQALEQRKETLLAELRALLLPKDPNDEKNVILEIRAGTGGEEASLFASELFRMYSRYAERRGWQVEVLNLSQTGLGGIKEVIALINGRQVYSRLKHESGVHRVQRVPATESSGRIHTSTATVAVLPEADDVQVEVNEKDLRVDTFCATGPGGQGVNTTYSAIRITHLPTGMVVQCQDERSQHKNKARALRILRSRLYERAREQRDSARAEQRRSLTGSGDRTERIRTYNFPQDRITDHRIGFTGHGLPSVLDGHLDPLLDALVEKDREERLARL